LSSAIKGETSGKYEVSCSCFVGGSELTSNYQRMLVAMCE
jgi:hypothetical protein